MTSEHTGNSRHRRFVAWFTRPPGRIYLAVLAADLAVIAWSNSAPGGAFLSWFIAYAGLFVLAVTGGVRMLWAKVRASGPLSARWYVAPVAVAVTLALCWIPRLPLHARFALSRGAMTSYAESFIATERRDGDTDHGSYDRVDRVGLYLATDATREPWGMRFAVPGAGFLMYQGGWAYAPHGRPSRDPGGLPIVYEHFSGPWFIYSEDLIG